MGSGLYRERMLETIRDNKRLMAQAQVRILALYEQCADDLATMAARPKTLTERWVNTYTAVMRERVSELWRDVGTVAEDGTRQAAYNAVAVQTDMLGTAALKAGVDLKATFARVFGSVPERAAESVLTGSVYRGKGAMLSKRIWNNRALQSGELAQVIAGSVAKQQSPIQLAKALEAYLNPGIIETDSWNDVYPDLPFPLNVTYSAKRLAVTSINHAAWSGTLIAAQNNPYAEIFHWELSAGHVIYDVCDGYAGHDEGLGEGNYPLSSAPMPHPFCTCVWYVDTAKSLDQVAEELGRWEEGESIQALDQAFERENVEI